MDIYGLHNNKLKLTISIIIMLSTIGQITTDIYMPSLPSMSTYFGYQISQLQLSIPIFTIGFSFGALFYGPLSDVYGRKPLIIVSLLLGLLGSLICLSATNYMNLIIGRLIQGLGLSGTGALSRAITRDVSTDAVQMAKLGSIINILYASATAIAPMLGGYVERYSFWRMNFVILSAYIVLMIIFIIFFLKETNQHKQKGSLQNNISNLKLILSSRSFVFPCISGSIGLSGLICFQTVAPYLLETKAKLFPDEYGYACFTTILPLLIGGYLNNRLLNKYSIKTLVRLGLLCYLICGTMYLLSYYLNIFNAIVVIGPFLIFSLGCSFILPACSANAMMSFKDSVGIASAIYGSFQMLGATLSSYLISIIGEITLLSLGLFFMSIYLLSNIMSRCAIVPYKIKKS